MILIGRNLNNLIIIVDLSKPASLTLVAENIRMFVSRGIPIRFGLVPLVGETSTTELEGTPDDSTAVAKIIWYLVERGGKKKTMDFIGEVRSIILFSGLSRYSRFPPPYSLLQPLHHHNECL